MQLVEEVRKGLGRAIVHADEPFVNLISKLQKKGVNEFASSNQSLELVPAPERSCRREDSESQYKVETF